MSVLITPFALLQSGAALMAQTIIRSGVEEEMVRGHPVVLPEIHSLGDCYRSLPLFFLCRPGTRAPPAAAPQVHRNQRQLGGLK